VIISCRFLFWFHFFLLPLSLSLSWSISHSVSVLMMKLCYDFFRLLSFISSDINEGGNKRKKKNFHWKKPLQLYNWWLQRTKTRKSREIFPKWHSSPTNVLQNEEGNWILLAQRILAISDVSLINYRSKWHLTQQRQKLKKLFVKTFSLAKTTK
jgi:hypothetical protein